jgi:hypothetical protein
LSAPTPASVVHRRAENPDGRRLTQKEQKLPRRDFWTKNAEMLKLARPGVEAGCIFGILVRFTTRLIVRSNSRTTQGSKAPGLAASRRGTFDADYESLRPSSNPKASGPSATDLQISPDYVYPTDIAYRLFHLPRWLAMSLTGVWTEGRPLWWRGLLGTEALLSKLHTLSTRLTIVSNALTWGRSDHGKQQKPSPKLDQHTFRYYEVVVLPHEDTSGPPHPNV